MHYYATPEETPAKMQDLMDAYTNWMVQIDNGEAHILSAAASLHHGLAEIHPFADGNGRTSRVLMNLLLMRAGYPPAVIRNERRDAYFGALAQADTGDGEPFALFVAEELETTMQLYLRALRGEPDPDAFSRRVAVLKKQVEAAGERSRFDQEKADELLASFILPLVAEAQKRTDLLKSMFGD